MYWQQYSLLVYKTYKQKLLFKQVIFVLEEQYKPVNLGDVHSFQQLNYLLKFESRE